MPQYAEFRWGTNKPQRIQSCFPLNLRLGPSLAPDTARRVVGGNMIHRLTLNTRTCQGL